MAFKILIFATRKAGTTPAQFRTHYEETHIPLIRALTGAAFPLSHVRRYLHRSNRDDINAPLTMLKGSPASVPFDVVSEVTFEDEQALKAFSDILARPELAERLKEDELAFLEPESVTITVLGEVNTTER